MEYLLLLQLVSPYKYSRRLSAILAVIWTIMWIIGFDGAYNFSAPAAAAASSTAAGPGRMWRSIERRLLNEDLSFCQNLVPSPNLEKFVDELPIPQSIHIDNGTQITLGAYKITQKLHRDLPPTTLYAFGTSSRTATYPGPTLLAQQGVESYVRFENHVHDEEPMFTVDRSILWANPKNGGVPLVTHLHGSETESACDGHPDSWSTAKGEHGRTYVSQNHTYANSQRPTLLWYHDHAFGITRLNILAGLVGFYVIMPPRSTAAVLDDQREKSPPAAWLPKEQFEVLLLIGDKQFFPNGSINFPNVGDSPKTHPNWCSEYYGDTILVNGKVWPYLKVQPKKYRFRLLNGANARLFELTLSDPRILPLTQIGTDGGLLEKPQLVSTILISPAERVDLVIDFSLVPVGTEIFMNNSGAAPYPDGVPSLSPLGTKSVMKFIVVLGQQHELDTATAGHDNSSTALPAIPSVLRKADPLISTKDAYWRTANMTETDDNLGNPVHDLLDNSVWTDPVTVKPVLGSTEVWEFINLTPDAHPMHVHLIQFRFWNQQAFNLSLYLQGTCSFQRPFPDPSSCFTEEPKGPLPNQIGWKDTMLAWPGYVTRILIKWTSQDGGPFPFDPTQGPGYIWHCHISDHEDNDMMRPFQVQHAGVH
ncbi:unnamed protein product [Sphagnum balticum]